MQQKLAALALMGCAVFTGYVYAGQQPTVDNPYLQEVLCGSRQVVDALQPAKLDGWEQRVIIANFTANAIGDKGLVCNIHAAVRRESRNGMTGEISQVDQLLLVGVTGEGTIVAEVIDRVFADSLLASQAAKAMATN